nr:helix-turn-helix transcriptional regulator [Nocardia mangyaensis]
MSRPRNRELAADLANAIDARRRELRMTRSELAERSGLHPSTITRIEKGVFVKPTPDSLHAIADALDMAPDELYAIAGWLTPTLPRNQPAIGVICQGVSDHVADDIERAIAEIATRDHIELRAYRRIIA